MNSIKSKKIIIISGTSDIAIEMIRDYLANDNEVITTYREISLFPKEFKKRKNLKLIKLNINSSEEKDNKVSELLSASKNWDFLIFATGTQKPVGNFEQVSFKDWKNSIFINAIGQLEILHSMLLLRNKNNNRGAQVLFFAGAGSNSAPTRYSAYISSKIFLTKMVELLHEEIPDVLFTIIGPGWVKTKIHNATIEAGKEYAGANYDLTIKKLGENLTSYKAIINTFNWCMSQPKKTVSGRNFSVVFDDINNVRLIDELNNNENMYKLRRFGNDWKGN